MGSNGKYSNIKPLLKSNTIRRYSEIFDVAVTKSAVARDMNININRFTRLIESPGQFKMRQIIRQTELLGVTLVQLIDLIEKGNLNGVEAFDYDKKDSRYRQIKTMVKIGKIKDFSDVFKYVPRYVIARDIRKGRSNWKNHGNYTFNQIHTLGKLCDLPFMKIYQLIADP